jgi:hypothetical protein
MGVLLLVLFLFPVAMLFVVLLLIQIAVVTKFMFDPEIIVNVIMFLSISSVLIGIAIVISLIISGNINNITWYGFIVE